MGRRSLIKATGKEPPKPQGAGGKEKSEKTSPPSSEVGQGFVELEKKHRGLPGRKKAAPGESQTMKSEQGREKDKEVLFRRFDDGPKEKPKKVQEPPVPPSCTPPPPQQQPVDKTLKYAIGAFAAVICVLLLASMSNSNAFRFRQNEQMVEVWQGRFAPMGERLAASFSDGSLLDKVSKDKVYSRKQAYVILSDYFVRRADEVLNTDEAPDLKAVNSYLTHASKYALAEPERQAINLRLKSIRFLVLLGKADVALSKGTVQEFEAAKKHLAEAVPLASTDLQKDVLMKRLAAVEYALANQKINKGEKQLAELYREALDRHLQKAKEYDTEKTAEIDEEISKIRKWLDDFDKRHVGR